MTDSERAIQRRASSNYRSRRSDQGEAQVQIWLPTSLRERLDQAVRAKGAKNRSEIVVDLLSNALEGGKM